MDRIISKINSLLQTESKIIIAIEGPCASGKTTLSDKLSEVFDCNIIHMDDFFLPFDRRTDERLCEIGGNIDYERFKTEVADKIILDSQFTYRKFNCSNGDFDQETVILPKKINIIEGVYSLHPSLIKIYNLKVFLEIDEKEKITRLNKRCPQKLQRFINDWIPMENKYFDHYQIKDKCDLIINNNSFISF